MATTDPGATAEPSVQEPGDRHPGSTWRKASAAQARPATTPLARLTTSTVARRPAATRAAVRSPRGRTSSAMARATASTTATRGGSRTGSSRPRPTGSRSAPASRSRPPAVGAAGSRRRTGPAPVGAVDDAAAPGVRQSGWSLRACAPRVSVRSVAEASTLRAAVTRLASSPRARSAWPRGTSRDGLVHRPARAPASESALRTTPGTVGHGPLQPVAGLGHVGSAGATVVEPVPARRPRRSAWPSTPATPPGSTVPSSTGPARRSAVGPSPRRGSSRPAGRRTPCPRAASSRRAGWPRGRPVQATSPAAHSPGRAVAPHRSVSTPPDR